MGSDKALLTIDGKTLLDRAVEGLRAVFRRVHVSVDPKRPYRLPGVGVIPDGAPGLGPLEGVRASLAALGAPALFAAVDLAHVSAPLARTLWQEASAPGRRGAVPRWSGGLEPAFAVYSPGLLEDIRAALDRGQRDLRRLAALRGVKVLDLESAEGRKVLPPGSPPPAALFRNLNAPEDLESLDGSWHLPRP